jgi:hypothetical protein
MDDRAGLFHSYIGRRTSTVRSGSYKGECPCSAVGPAIQLLDPLVHFRPVIPPLLPPHTPGEILGNFFSDFSKIRRIEDVRSQVQYSKA